MTQLDYAIGWLVLIRPELITYFEFGQPDGYFLCFSEDLNERKACENRKS